MDLRAWVWLQVLAFWVAACAQPASGGRVTGRVTYLQRIALSPAAVVQVQLIDLSRADAAASMLAEQTLHPQHQVPIPFELAYDPSRIVPAHRYGVRARITDGDRLAFTNDLAVPVLTQGAPSSVEVVVHPVGGP